MPVFSFFKRNQNMATAGAVDEAATVQVARSRARHRLIGAVVLVVVGIVAFPLLFESQPRPLAVDIPIEVQARRDLVPPTVPVPASAAIARSRAPIITERATDALPAEPVDVAAPASAAAKPALAASKPTPVDVAERPVAAALTAPVASAPAAAQRSAEAKRAQSLLDGNDATAAANTAAVPAEADAAAPRFVVQAGAYGDASSLRDARQKVEKLGLKTYTQVVQTDTGTRTRVRVGPFATRDEAEKAAQRIKASGLAVNILAL